ncbi:methionyl-tRNA formyltransferase [Thermoactinomyces vulgaris]|jgi:methionyl-tRNA formyltransferase|uniref:methionyl-tRNA formyltransferase n=1 Tax=Thermoactinomyces TaxID=2023 RepID=UPI000503E33B|nr:MULTISPECIES: methionyl-tRNA formyltransferase [Thermoactinomyces]KFZ40606.1 methionyl-tRNA formyltransferase [Thermoactinomyces sp. Gus2-1]MBH8582777.1 methionyl-tRNA formyltransferase [Thermoactinomyces sp. CICC 10735]MBI0391708.1 methionyl-tRNA formyltransferase [Thermoactinomyces sp. CICC 24226]MCF6135142.1 methionyl-tRNA formyltransferase [Thermoactinomyces vulgaris]QBK14598.1 methionyl-tRNA formyltransferase [Thermoactinomyces vulgaris]
MGTPDFAVPSLRLLLEEKDQVEVIGVVTQPDRPKGRKKVLTPPPVKVEAIKHDLPVFQPQKLRSEEAIRQVLELQPDLIVTAAYGQILPEPVLNAPKYGCINVHASLLPKYRGGAPIHHAIINGEKETGVTIMYMVKALDAGDMLLQRAIPITSGDNVGTMHDKLANLGAELLKEVLPSILDGTVQAVPQDDEQATFAPNITREDEKIDWERTAQELDCQIRGLCPWPVAYTLWKGKPFKIWKASVVNEETQGEPGTVIRLDNNGIVVATGKGLLRLTEVQPSGKKPMPARQFINGRQMKAGDRFGD